MNKYEKFSKEAQDRYRKFRACERKTAFSSKEEAEFRTNQRVYKCEYCSKWHRTGAFQRLLRRARKHA